MFVSLKGPKDAERLLTLKRVDELWRENKAEIEKDAQNLTTELEKYMNEGKSGGADSKLPEGLLLAAAKGFADGYDPTRVNFHHAIPYWRLIHRKAPGCAVECRCFKRGHWGIAP